jgi:sugar fermentation stimulation protein A
LIKRYKRFLADVRCDDDGKVVTALCPNTGSMKSCCEAGRPVMLSYHGGDSRKYPYTLEMIHMDRGWVGVNTALPNSLVALAVKYGMIPELISYTSVRREIRYGENSRIDLLLEGPPGRCWVEVKNVSLLEGTAVCFPDAVSQRGTKHLEELIKMVRRGDRAVILFLVQRGDGEVFLAADHIDPLYGETLRRAVEAGVEVLVYRALVSPGGIRWGELLKKDLAKFDGGPYVR